MGSRGPAPKRESQRRRRNKPAIETRKGVAAQTVKVPRARGNWHPLAKAWFVSLRDSGQSQYYEASDWALALVVAEELSRQLGGKSGGAGKPMGGAALQSLLHGMSLLLNTEVDRRRAGIELDRPEPEKPLAAPGKVSHLADARARVRGSSTA